MKIWVIQSGSKGNATIIEHDGRILLVDMGITLKALNEALCKLNKNIYNIDALLLTHDHSDHTNGIKYLPPLPIYTLLGNYDASNVVAVNPYEEFNVSSFDITPIKTSHDGINPCGFIIKAGDEKLVYLTDSGIIPCKTQAKIKNADYYIFESNHDVEMLMNTNRPYLLKKRILSNKGHLSNVQSANYLSKLIGKNTKEIILAHLSEEANTPEVAINTHLNIYKDKKVSIDNIKIHCASQHEILEGGNL